MKNSEQDAGITQSDVMSDTLGPMLSIDYELYQHYLDDSDLSEAEKKEFLDTLWSIIVSFVDLGFGVHPMQQVCEQNIIPVEYMTTYAKNMLEKNGKSNSKRNIKSGKSTDLPEERNR